MQSRKFPPYFNNPKGKVIGVPDPERMYMHLAAMYKETGKHFLYLRSKYVLALGLGLESL